MGTDSEMLMASICQRFGCSSRDVEFYLSALGSYFVARPMLESVATSRYDDAHEEVFAAIEYNQENE